ncbi:MAG: hypothetical protein EXS05_21665 [Planctomycetaceae bacterium]|nr:hypothetical protein [Planctomycetaceae bacterium]
MPLVHRRMCCAAAVVCISTLLLVCNSPSRAPEARQTLAAESNLRWYKGNLHTHTLWSDGDDYPEMVALWYKERGYDFLGFSDHNTLLRRERWIDAVNNKGGERALEKMLKRFPQDWVEQHRNEQGALEIRLKTFDEITARIGAPGEFLLIQGEEISDHFGKLPVHLNATNVQEVIPPLGGESVYEVIQRNTDALIAQRERLRQPMLIHLNHPNFGFGVTAEDLMRVRGENFFEVYNGHPGVNNAGDDQHASAERIWDIILTSRLTELQLPLMFGLATDDGHSYHEIPSRNSEPGRGWVMVLADELTPAALIDALERGRFYASSGVQLSEVSTSPTRMEIAVKAEANVEYAIDFIGTRKGFDSQSQPVLGPDGQPMGATRRYSAEVGRVLRSVTGTRAKYDLTPDDLYVRARVTSTKRHYNPSVPGEFERAWCQPQRGPAAAK